MHSIVTSGARPYVRVSLCLGSSRTMKTAQLVFNIPRNETTEYQLRCEKAQPWIWILLESFGAVRYNWQLFYSRWPGSWWCSWMPVRWTVLCKCNSRVELDPQVLLVSDWMPLTIMKGKRKLNSRKSRRSRDHVATIVQELQECSDSFRLCGGLAWMHAVFHLHPDNGGLWSNSISTTALFKCQLLFDKVGTTHVRIVST